MKNDLMRGVQKSNRRMKVGPDALWQQVRDDAAYERRVLRAERKAKEAHEERLRQQAEDRDRYMIPEHMDLEEILTHP